MNEINTQAAHELLKFERDNTFIFMGSGMSRPPYMGWWELLNELRMKTGLEYKSDNPLKAAQEMSSQEPDIFFTELFNTFKEEPSHCRRALEHILNITYKSVITTNFDKTIDCALTRLNLRAVTKIYVYPEIQYTDCENGAVSFIHGKVVGTNSKSFKPIFNASSYQEAYFETKTAARFMYDVLNKNNVLFIGFGIGADEPIRLVIQAVNNRKKESEADKQMTQSNKPCWSILLQQDMMGSEFITELNNWGISVIFYDPIDAEHSGLDEIWDYVWARKKHEKPTVELKIINPLAELDGNWTNE